MAEDRFGQIPEPSEDPQALLNTVKALMVVVAQLTGSSGGISPTRNFYQQEAPTALQAGDTWTRPSPIAGQGTVDSVWDGTQWLSGSSNGVPPGMVLAYAGLGTPPGGWLACGGQAVSRTQFAPLFKVCQTTFGVGDGSTTFNVPDLRGRVIACSDAVTGSAAGRLTGTIMTPNGQTVGAVGGAQTVTLGTGEIPSHSHGYSDPGHFHSFLHGGSTPAAFTGRAGDGDGTNNYFQATDTKAIGITIAAAGGGGAHSNTQPTMIMNVWIKT
jgi:microcystin-dependent protein